MQNRVLFISGGLEVGNFAEKTMGGKIILITGASDGIGKETAMAKTGHTVIMHGRNPAKTAAACEEIKAQSGNDNVEYLIAPYLLTCLLMDILRRSPSARVVTVSSEAHRMGGTPRLDDIELEHRYSIRRSYGLSKLYAIWMMRGLSEAARREGICNVTFNTVHPGSAVTNLDRVSKGDFMTRILYILWRPMMKSAAEGAASSIYAATSPEIEGVTGLTVRQHTHEQLIVRAKELLASTTLSVNEVAYALGFEYPQYFSRLFKQKTTLSPSAFRRKFQG